MVHKIKSPRTVVSLPPGVNQSSGPMRDCTGRASVRSAARGDRAPHVASTHDARRRSLSRPCNPCPNSADVATVPSSGEVDRQPRLGPGDATRLDMAPARSSGAIARHRRRHSTSAQATCCRAEKTSPSEDGPIWPTAGSRHHHSRDKLRGLHDWVGRPYWPSAARGSQRGSGL